MDSIGTLILQVLYITFLDLLLSGDNIGLIALVTKDLSPKLAKKASAVGVSLAVGLRIVFAIFITFLLSIKWLPLSLIGGIFLVKICFDMMKEGEETVIEKNSSESFWKAVVTIVLADGVMSLDNVIAISGAAQGNIKLIFFGIALSIPIIFFGSQYFMMLLKKYKMALYIACGVLLHAAAKMILDDQFLNTYIPINILIKDYLPWIVAILLIVFGFIKTHNNKKHT